MTSTSRWESSTRPLVVRTVWVNGLRHAILTPPVAVRGPWRGPWRGSADGERRDASRLSLCTSPSRPPSSASDESDHDQPHAELQDEQHELAHCLVRWKLVVGQERQRSGGSSRGRDRTLGEDDEGADADGEEEGEDHDSQLPPAPTLLGSYTATFQPLCAGGGHAKLASGLVAATVQDEDTLGSQYAVAATALGDRRPGDSDQNPLSERVLQWLDLAGRAVEHSLVAKGATLRRGVSTAGPSRRTVPGTATAPRSRRFYPVAASEVPAADRRLSRRSSSVDTSAAAAVPLPIGGPPGGPPAARLPGPATPPPPPATPPLPPPPLIQTFQHVATARSWSSTSSQSRPQLHIFVPAVAVPEKLNALLSAAPTEVELSDCESGISDA